MKDVNHGVLNKSDIWLAKDMLNKKLETTNDEMLVHVCGNCAKPLHGYHSGYSGKPSELKETLCPHCGSALFRSSSVIMSRGMALRHSDSELVKNYIHARADVEFWHGVIAISKNVDNTAALLDYNGKISEQLKKTSLVSVIDWEPKCPVCGIELEEAKFDFHHWDYESDRGLQICRDCHNDIHTNSPDDKKLKNTNGDWKVDAIQRIINRAEKFGQVDDYPPRLRFNIPHSEYDKAMEVSNNE